MLLKLILLLLLLKLIFQQLFRTSFLGVRLLGQGVEQRAGHRSLEVQALERVFKVALFQQHLCEPSNELGRRYEALDPSKIAFVCGFHFCHDLSLTDFHYVSES